MKIRLLRIIWIASFCWLALIVYGGTLGTAQGQLAINLMAFGWPALLGFVICYFITGSVEWPKESSEMPLQAQQTPEQSFKGVKPNDESVEVDFLDGLEKSRRLIAKELEASRLALEEKWKNQFSEDLKKVEKTEELIRKSNVVESCLSIAKQTYHWQSWIKNQNENWHFPNWISNRLLPINEERSSSITLESYSALLGEMITERNTSLQTAFGFRDGENEIRQYLYSTSDFDGTYFGRLLVKLNDELMLDVSVSRDLDDEYDEWRFGGGQIHVAKIGNWMSSILNLEEEFKGHDLLEETERKLRTHTHKINNLS